MTLEDIPHFDPNKAPVVDINGIKELLPHRPPFLMVDRIVEMGDDYVVGIKNIGIVPKNKPMVVRPKAKPGAFFRTETSRPKVTDIVILNNITPIKDINMKLAKIDNTKFKRKVVPGDTLVLKLILTQPVRHSMVSMHGQAYVGDTLVCESDMIAQIIKNKE